MAQHIKLSESDEPKVFKTLERLKFKITEFGKTHKGFERGEVEKLKVMKLSPEYVEHNNDVAFMVGSFTLEQDLEEDQWLAIDCSLEVHYKIVDKDVFLKAVYWVV